MLDAADRLVAERRVGEELIEFVGQSRQELFNLRFQHATGQLENTARVREVLVETEIAPELPFHERERSRYGGARALDLVDQLVFEQSAHQGAASVHLQLSPRLRLQLAGGRMAGREVGPSVWQLIAPSRPTSRAPSPPRRALKWAPR